MRKLVISKTSAATRLLIATTSVLGGVSLTANAQEASIFDDTALNIDILPLQDACIAPGESFTFEVVTRLIGGSFEGEDFFGISFIDYTVSLGSLTDITFAGLNADGSFVTAPASTYGTVTGFMVDSLDADNEFLSSTAASDPGILAASDTLDRPEAGAMWDSDWVIEMTWTAPLDAPSGNYPVTAFEEVDFSDNMGNVFPDFATASFPGTHTPFDLCIVPEPTGIVSLSGILWLGLFLRKRR